MWNLKYATNEPTYKIETDSVTYITDLWLPWGRGRWREMDWKAGVGKCKLLHSEWIKNKVLIYSTGNYTEYPVINHIGKEYLKRNICICITESLCYRDWII